MAALLTDVVDAGDVRMIEPGALRASISNRPCESASLTCGVGQHLHRHHAMQPRIDAAKHGPHPATADKLFEPNVAQLLTNQRPPQLTWLLPLAKLKRRQERLRRDHRQIIRQRRRIIFDIEALIDPTCIR